LDSDSYFSAPDIPKGPDS